VCHRFDRYHAMALGVLSLTETVDRGNEPYGEVGRFDKHLNHVAVLGIAGVFLLAVA